MLPFVICLCPTYGRHSCLQEMMYCYSLQDYPVDRRILLISDDLGNIKEGSHHLEGVHVLSRTDRFTSITSKYQHLWLAGLDWYANRYPTGGEPIILIMEDDDLYAPWYIRSHVDALLELKTTQGTPTTYSQPHYVLSDGGGRLMVESSHGRFFASIGMWTSSLARAGGFGISRRADFDQDLMHRLSTFSRVDFREIHSRPPINTLRYTPVGLGRVSYIYRWSSSNADHGSQYMTSPDDTGWWDRSSPKEKDPVLQLVPGLRSTAQAYYDYMLTLVPLPVT